MGRVYNALLRSERMKENDRPIGRPARVQTPPAPVAVPARDVKAAVSAEVERGQKPAFDKPAFDLPKVETIAASNKAESITGFEAEHAAPLDFSELIALGEMIAASPRREVKTQTRPRSSSRPSGDLRGAFAPANVPAFVEPRQLFTVSKTTVATCLTAITGDDRLACERYRTLGVRLLNLAAKRKLKTVIVTSAREHEGKSTVATNLAWVMAKPGERRILVIDANPDSAAVCRMLGVKPQRGWTDVIEDGAQISDAMVRIDPNGLYVLAAGPEKSSPYDTGIGNRGFDRSDGLASPRLEKLIAELERHFDFVIIDAPTIKNMNAQRLASIADSTVMVVRAGRTPHDEVTEALKLVPRDACAGIVLNESDTKEQFTRKDRKTLLARLVGRGRN
jgi:capsular exopolysaccharide synthesis family protein